MLNLARQLKLIRDVFTHVLVLSSSEGFTNRLWRSLREEHRAEAGTGMLELER